MSRVAIEQMLWLMDKAFSGAPGEEHSLLANLESLREDDWHWLPSGGARSVFEIAIHVGECKFVYESHAFGDGSMTWMRPRSIPRVGRGAMPYEVLDWLREAHGCFRGSVEALPDDDELLKLRKSNWGQEYETRWLISVMIEHDLYHAGEINHIRSLHHEKDRWAWLEETSLPDPLSHSSGEGE
jgi:hypothetical protein